MINYSEPEHAMEAVPVISFARAFSHSREERIRLAREIGHACRHTGFFYLIDHGLPLDLLKSQLVAAEAFFAHPLQEKMLYVSSDKGQRGFEPMAAQALDEGSPPDLKESILLGPEIEEWPKQSDFAAKVTPYFEAIQTVGRAVARCLALSLDLEEEYFETMLQHPNCTVRMLHYPPHPASALDNQIGAGAHTDWGFLTLLLQDDIGGLEVQTKSGRWLRADPVEESLVVNLGDILPHMTGGLYQSNFHRVMNNRSGRDRYSIATFFNPPSDTLIECVPTCRVQGREVQAVTVGDHVAAKIRETYGVTV